MSSIACRRVSDRLQPNMGPALPAPFGWHWEDAVHDRSHKLLFAVGCASMCAAVLYASQTMPALLGPPAQRAASVATGPELRDFHSGSADQSIAFVSAEENRGTSPAGAGDDRSPSTATVLPNATSCPSADLGALASRPAQRPVETPPLAATPAQPPLQSGAALGTGSSCPPQRSNTRVVPPGAVAGRPQEPLAALTARGATPPLAGP
jgi:hypothetical protein